MFLWKQRRDGSWNGYLPNESGGQYVVSTYIQSGHPYQWVTLVMEGEYDTDKRSFVNAEAAKQFLNDQYNTIKVSVEKERRKDVMIVEF